MTAGWTETQRSTRRVREPAATRRHPDWLALPELQRVSGLVRHAQVHLAPAVADNRPAFRREQA